MTPIWTSDPEAQTLLASCAERPPEKRTFNYRFGDTDTRYIGDRVKLLRAVRARYMDETLDTPAFIRNSAMTVDNAIDEARTASGYRETCEEGFTVVPMSPSILAEAMGDPAAVGETVVEQHVRLRRGREQRELAA